MASPSENQRTLCPSTKPYDVFLNHRGPDTKNTLASFIYHSLSESGVNVFFDKREFVPGQNLPGTIHSAIFSSSVQIAILSPRYAESNWCLDELSLMQKAVQSKRAELIPVFYDILPEDIDEPQNNEGVYAESLGELEQKMSGNERRFKPTEIEEWKKALKEVKTTHWPLISYMCNEDLGKVAVAVCGRVMYHLGRKSSDGLAGLERPFFTGVQETEIMPYDVFICHGPDTKNNLASFIYHSFFERGVNVFINEAEFVAGDEMSPIKPEAISTSLVRIAILSPRYADSRWRLEVLHLMQKPGSTFIPVFYEVPPGSLQQLKNNQGMYANALMELERDLRLRRDATENWRPALYKVSNISGVLVSEMFDGDMGALAVAVRSEAVKHLRRVWKKSADGFFGIEEAIDDFRSFLDVNNEQSEKVKIVGIVGTPGCGKTTLAEEFYFRCRVHFDRSSLLLRVRKASKQKGLQTLQSQLLKDLTNDSLEISNISEGKDILADRVRRLCHTRFWKFLVVIDDIYSKDQLEALIKIEDVLRSGSLIIVTSHSEAVLKLSGISLIYRTRALRSKDARELLCRIVFQQSQPIDGFKDLTQTALSKCGCFPKFLQSLGGNLRLYGKNVKQDWENEMQMMTTEIFEAIFGNLEEEERQIFLDVACFFEEMDKNSAIRVWNGSGWRGSRSLQKLEYMCLLQVDDTDRILIPPFLRDLGREIADRQLHEAPDLPCRLWRPNVARNFLKKPLLQEGAKIRGTREASHKKLSERSTEELFKIELLHVTSDISSDTFSDHLRNFVCFRWGKYATFSDCLRNLIWLRWENCPQTPILPPEMNNLRVLELIEGNFKTLGPNIKLPEELREIIVKECTRLVQIPPTIGLLTHLEKMTLDGTTSLESLPPEFCKLQALKHLVLRQCECLIALPDDFGKLINLQYIDFSYCQLLSSLPRSFRELIRMESLEVRNCWNLRVDEDIFEQIRSIEELTMENCKKLTTLPDLTTLQGSLKKLNLLGTSISELPGSIDQLRELQELKIGSPFLRTIPGSLANLPSLMELELINCTGLPSHPSAFGSLLLIPSKKQSREANLVQIRRVYRRSPNQAGNVVSSHAPREAT